VALNITVIRDLEDLIIDAMYQDVIRGKLDQEQGMFEVEWSMGRDLRPDELSGIVDALATWSKRTSAVLETLDNEIQRIKREEKHRAVAASQHEKQFQDNLRDANEKVKSGPHSENKVYRRERGAGAGLSRGDSMDVDDMYEAGLRGPMSSDSSSRKPMSSDGARFGRKRTRP